MPTSQRYDFPNAAGQQLSGRLELPDGPPLGVAIFAHCFTCSKNIKAAVFVSRRLCELGIAVLRFDFTGLGNSQGDFANTDFSSNVRDLVAAGEALNASHTPPVLLVGHSLGGAAALFAAADISSVRAVATINAPSEPEFVTELLGSQLATVDATGSAAVSIDGRQFTLRRDFIDDLRQASLAEHLGNLPQPLLIFHASNDAVVPIAHAYHLLNAAQQPKSLITIDGGDHMLANLADATFVAETLAAWAKRYLPVAER